jgi:hypothetical protein
MMINLLLYVVFLALIVYGGTVEALGPKNGSGGGGTLLISAVWTCSICSGKLWLELRGCSAGLMLA